MDDVSLLAIRIAESFFLLSTAAFAQRRRAKGRRARRRGVRRRSWLGRVGVRAASSWLALRLRPMMVGGQEVPPPRRRSNSSMPAAACMHACSSRPPPLRCSSQAKDKIKPQRRLLSTSLCPASCCERRRHPARVLRHVPLHRVHDRLRLAIHLNVDHVAHLQGAGGRGQK